MTAVHVILLALVHIGLLVVMSVSAVSILNDDIRFTDDGTFSIDRATVKRIAIKLGIFFVGIVGYIFMLWTFKFIG